MKHRLMVALDVPDIHSALEIRDTLIGEVGWLKVGLRLFVAEGPALVSKLLQHHRIFLDLKFHDIPNTVAQAVEQAGSLGIHMLNVHASGGATMLKRAAEAAARFPDMKLIAVTVLTSEALAKKKAENLVLSRAMLAKEQGLHGIVCSVHEVAAVKKACGNNFITVTPGVRWGGQNIQDQKRVATPCRAIAEGSDYLVVGRPILQANNRISAVHEACAMMEQGLQKRSHDAS